MASNKRKKTFPKPPQRFHSKLAHELGKWSNKNGTEANIKAIYSQPARVDSKLTQDQTKQVAKLREAIAKRRELCNHETPLVSPGKKSLQS